MDLTEAEKNDIIEMRNTPHLYNKMVESVCPSVFGHLDVKRGVLLMLFGGVQKSTPEGIVLPPPLSPSHPFFVSSLSLLTYFLPSCCNPTFNPPNTPSSLLPLSPPSPSFLSVPLSDE